MRGWCARLRSRLRHRPIGRRRLGPRVDRGGRHRRGPAARRSGRRPRTSPGRGRCALHQRRQPSPLCWRRIRCAVRARRPSRPATVTAQPDGRVAGRRSPDRRHGRPTGSLGHHDGAAARRRRGRPARRRCRCAARRAGRGKLFFFLGVQWGLVGEWVLGVVVVAADQVDGVGDGAGVLVGGDGVVGVDVGEVFGGDMQQAGGGPAGGVGGIDRRDKAGPGRVGDDGFGGRRSKNVVQVGNPGRA